MNRDMDDFQSNPQVIQKSCKTFARRTYLVTYSQADLAKSPIRKEFSKCIKKHFNIDQNIEYVLKKNIRRPLPCFTKADWPKGLEIFQRFDQLN